MLVASASYGLGAVAFAVLALTCRRSGNTELRVQYPAAITSVWALFAAGQAWLDLQCGMIQGASRGVLVLGAPDTGPYVPVSVWPGAKPSAL